MSLWKWIDAAVGGLAGLAVGGPAGAVTGAGLGFAVGGSTDASSAAADAGDAQAQAAREQIAAAQDIETKSRADRMQAFGLAASAAQPSAIEMARVQDLLDKSDASLQQQLKIIAQGQSVLDSVDASVKEAGNQTLALLQGHDAAVLQPIRNQRATQKSQLEQQLASKLGSGYKTTAAGIMALNSFDNDTSNLLTNAQFQAFSQVSGAQATLGSLSGQLRSGMVTETANAYSSSGQLEQQGLADMDQQKARKIQAAEILAQSPVNYSAEANASQNLSNVIGNQYAGQIAMNQTLAGIGGQIGQAGLTHIFSSGTGTGSTPTPSGQPIPASSPMAPGAPGYYESIYDPTFGSTIGVPQQ